MAAGATLVRLLQQELYVPRTAEATRLRACRKESLSFPICFGGVRNAAMAETLAGTNDNAKLEKVTQMPLSKNMTVFDMRRYTTPKKLIYNLGTDPVCLALVLAGASVTTTGVIVELGTFTGLSTKCLALGLNATGPPNRYYAFDIFGKDVLNYQAIIKNMPWVTDVGTLTADSSYKWLWELAVQHVYPTIQGFEGFIDKDTVNPKVWNKQSIALLSIDSAKMWGQFRDQLAGIQKPYMLKRGAILVLMDFLTIDTQIKLLYGCWREYLQPVYSSWCRGEQWMFVVTRTFSLTMVGSCMQDLLGDDQSPSADKFKDMEVQIMHDVDFLDGLFEPPVDVMEEERRCMSDKLITKLHQSSGGHWHNLRVQ
jgi:hypothetical protein